MSQYLTRRTVALSLIFISALVFCEKAGAADNKTTPPEFRSFTPAGETQLVDPFTGDFQYNITLLEVPGPRGSYPINLSYHSGISMDEEASWVGLGWTLNAGSIQHQVRGWSDDHGCESSTNCGVCDDSNTTRDCITEIRDIEWNQTYGLAANANFELFGVDPSTGRGTGGPNVGFKLYYNNARGLGLGASAGLSGQLLNSGISGGIGLAIDSQDGIKANASLSLYDRLRLGANLDAVRGLSNLSFGEQIKFLKLGTRSESFGANHNVLTFLGYGKPASFPPLGQDLNGDNVNLTFKVGLEIQGTYVNAQFQGFLLRQYLQQRKTSTPISGYLHLDDADANVAVDFNREKDGPLYDDSPNLAIPVMTHDLYTVSAQGMAGTFRAYRNDIPVVFDKKHGSVAVGGALGVELGLGVLFKLGFDGSLNQTTTDTERWDGGKGDNGTLLQQFQDAAVTKTGKPFSEPFVFKFIGESSTGMSSDRLPGGDAPIMATLRPDFSIFAPLDSFRADGNLRIGSPTGALTSLLLAYPDRVTRASLIQSFTNADLFTNSVPRSQRSALADLGGEFSSDKAVADLNLPAEDQRWRQAPGRSIGAFRVTGTDGTRYEYGLAVYNQRLEQHEFSVDRDQRLLNTDCTIIVPQKVPSPDDPTPEYYNYSLDSTAKYLHIRRLPAYASAYLLTAILGPDYVDADNIPGPSVGDIGYWIKFTYVKVADHLPWREPYFGVRFVRGYDNGLTPFLGSKPRRNDKGVFTYGEREQWYLSTVETKTHIAVFTLDKNHPRTDITEPTLLQDAPANPTSKQPLYPLSTISLYARDEYTTGSAEPLQEVHFTYTYDLTPGIPSSATGSGRLTLAHVWTTYRHSSRGAFSPYDFDYGQSDPKTGPDANPGFGYKSMDRWGTYRKLNGPSGCSDSTSVDPSRNDPSLDGDVIYTPQDKKKRDAEVAAWTLRTIVEPTGRVINVAYESDDYGFVQDAPAMTMVGLASVNDGGNPAYIPDVTNSSARVFVQTPPNLTASDFERLYVPNDKQILFRIRVGLLGPATPGQNNGKQYEYVSGYAKAVSSGTTTDNNGNSLGWIDLEPVQGYHPFSIAAWQHLKLQQPELIFEAPFAPTSAADVSTEIMKVVSLVDSLDNVTQLFTKGMYYAWQGFDYGRWLDLSHSWIRLKSGSAKLGGGMRVKAITYSDAWKDEVPSEDSATYGTKYFYTLEDGSTSGVAANEPFIGGEENSLHNAKPFSAKTGILVSDYNLFFEGPANESYYPAPIVGYSRIVARSLASDQAFDQTTHGGPLAKTKTAGPTVYEFYTAKDFPVRISETTIDKQRNPWPSRLIPIPFLGNITLELLAASQGYSIVLNDMHGKAKRISTYEYTNTPGSKEFVTRSAPVSATEYVYKTTADGDRLENHAVNVLAVDGPVSTTALANEAEMFADMRFSSTESIEGGININTDTILAGIFPFPIPVPIPNIGYSLTAIRTVVLNKVIQEGGILDHVVTHRGESSETTQMLARDPIAGQPLLTSTTNAYVKPVFSYVMPGRWQYGTMAPAYLNTGVELSTAQGSLQPGPGTFTLQLQSPSIPICSLSVPHSSTCIALGDELVDFKNSAAVDPPVFTVTDDTGGTLTLMSNTPLTTVPTGPLVVVRSGNRNLLGLNTAAVRAMSDPTVARTSVTCSLPPPNDTFVALNNVLDASATTFNSYWPGIVQDARFDGTGNERLGKLNALKARTEFANGTRGIWRRAQDYVYVSDRDQATPVDLSHNGTMQGVPLFGGDTLLPAKCGFKWRAINESTRYSPSGPLIESKNILNIYSASLYGRLGSVPIALAENAKNDEIGFEGFEEFSPSQVVAAELMGTGNIDFATLPLCRDSNDREAANVEVVAERSHTGVRSLAVYTPVAFRQDHLSLVPKRRYVVGAWVYTNNIHADRFFQSADTPLGEAVGIQVQLWSNKKELIKEEPPLFEPTGPVIEGWRRIEGVFEMPADIDGLDLKFQNGVPYQMCGQKQVVAFFDDVRIYPNDGRLETEVYDAALRVSAILDENNFATFYSYDDQGSLFLIRKETDRGILTVEDARSHLREK